MLEKTNSVYVIGTLVEVKKHQTGTFVKEGKEVPYVSATIIVKCDINGQENLKNVPDRLIAKDIIADTFAEQQTGIDKGYDTFIDVAKKLGKKYSNVDNYFDEKLTGDIAPVKDHI